MNGDAQETYETPEARSAAESRVCDGETVNPDIVWGNDEEKRGVEEEAKGKLVSLCRQRGDKRTLVSTCIHTLDESRKDNERKFTKGAKATEGQTIKGTLTCRTALRAMLLHRDVCVEVVERTVRLRAIRETANIKGEKVLVS